jgi:hypothetical protein
MNDEERRCLTVEGMKVNIQNEKENLVPKISDKLSVNQAGEVATLLHPQSGHIFVINAVAQRIIELCDGHRTVSEIVRAISDEFAVPNEANVIQDIDQFFTKASQKGLIAWN